MHPHRQTKILWQDASAFFRQERVDLTKATMDSYMDTLSRLLDGLNVGNIGRLHILKFLQQYQNPASYNRNLYAIKSFFDWASDFYRIPNPAIGLKCKKQDSIPDVRVLSMDEYKMIYALEGQYRDIAVFLCNTGIRAGSFCSLRPEHCHSDYIVVFVKGSKTLKVPLNKTAKAILDKYDNRINFNFSKEHYYLKHNLKYACNWLSDELNIPHINPHSLRHFFATTLLKKGASIQSVSSLLGHSSINITISRYYHPDDLSKSVGLLDF